MKIDGIVFGSIQNNKKLRHSAKALALAAMLVPSAANASYDINIKDQIRRDYFVRNNAIQNSTSNVNQKLLQHSVPKDKREQFDFNKDGKIDLAEKASYGEFLELIKYDRNNDGIISCSLSPKVMVVCGEESYIYNGKKEVMYTAREVSNDSHEVMGEDFDKLTELMTNEERIKHLKQIKFNAALDGEIYDNEPLGKVIKNADIETIVSYLQSKIYAPDFEKTMLSNRTKTVMYYILHRLEEYHRSVLPDNVVKEEEWFNKKASELNLFPKELPDDKNIFDVGSYREINLVPVMMDIRKNNPALREKLVNQMMLKDCDYKMKHIFLSELYKNHPYAAILLLTPDKPMD